MAGPVPIPGFSGFYLCDDGGLAIALPRLLWRPAGGRCSCRACQGADAFWDTLRVHPHHSTGWLVHWPDLGLEAA